MRRLRHHLLAAMLLCAVVLPSAAQQIVVELRAVAGVDEGTPRLADMAVVTGDDEGRFAIEVGYVSLSRGPRLGWPVLFTRDEIVRRIRERLPHLADQISVIGAPVVKVTLNTQPVDRARLESAARESLAAAMRSVVAEYSAAFDDDQKSLELPIGSVRYTARPLRLAQLAKRVSVWVDVSVAGREVRAVPVPFVITALGDVYRLRRAAAAGDVVAVDDVQVDRVDLAELTAPPLALDEAARGWRITKPLPAGAVLLRSCASPRVAVSRGDEVKIVHQGAGLSIERAGRALQDGEPGQRVRVWPSGGSAEVTARVAAIGVVIVEGN